MIISKIWIGIYLPDIFILYSQTFTSSLKLQNIFHDPQTMTPVSPYLELINNIYKLSLNEYNLALVQRQRQDFGFSCLPNFSVKKSGKRSKRGDVYNLQTDTLQATSSSVKKGASRSFQVSNFIKIFLQDLEDQLLLKIEVVNPPTCWKYSDFHLWRHWSFMKKTVISVTRKAKHTN